MKISFPNALCFVTVALCLTACQQADPVQQAVDALPKLPAELAAELDTLPGTQVLVTRNKYERTLPPAVKPTAVALAPACSSVDRFVGQIVYPMTVCYPPPFLVTDINEFAMAPVPGRPKPERPAQPIDEVKGATMTAYRLALKPNANLFCRSHGGPWAVNIYEHMDCSGAQWCELEIVGAPAYITYGWPGTVADRPADPYVFDVQGTGDGYRTACGGLTNCSGDLPPPEHP